MNPKGFQQYKQQAVNTMTPGELLIVLYSELVKRLTQAELAFDKEDYAVFEASLDRAVSIIQYLDNTLDRKYEISGNLAQLYEYFIYELGRARIGRNKEVVAHVCSMAKELKESFEQANQTANSVDSGK